MRESSYYSSERYASAALSPSSTLDSRTQSLLSSLSPPLPIHQALWALHTESTIPLVRDACDVLTNYLPGFIATDAHGQNPKTCEDNFLPAGTYCYFVGSPQVSHPTYEIVLNFEAWVFPGPDMPAHWSRQRDPEQLGELGATFGRPGSDMSTAVKYTDQRCIVTKFGVDSCENARLIPQDEIDWFAGNAMELYCYDPASRLDDLGNGITLRCDVRRC